MFWKRKKAPAATEQPNNIAEYFGVYKGFTPTDESAICMGELEVKIDESKVSFRMATGLKIQKDEVSTSKLEHMTREDMVEALGKRNRYVDRSVGFHANGMKYIFTPNPTKKEYGLVIRGNELADMLGPTALYSPSQQQAGLYDKALNRIIRKHGDVLPQLQYDGKTKPKGS